MGNEKQVRKLSLSRELLLLIGSAEALRLAAERHIEGRRTQQGLMDFVFAMAGGLLLHRDRLRLVESVVVGASNPSLILCHANQADVFEEGPGVIPEWSAQEALERHEAERRAARNRSEWESRGKIPMSFVLHKSPRDGRE